MLNPARVGNVFQTGSEAELHMQIAYKQRLLCEEDAFEAYISQTPAVLLLFLLFQRNVVLDGPCDRRKWLPNHE